MSIRPTRLITACSPAFHSIKSKSLFLPSGVVRIHYKRSSFLHPTRSPSRDSHSHHKTTLLSGFSLSFIATGVAISVASYLLLQSYVLNNHHPDAALNVSTPKEAIEPTSEVPWIRIYPGMPPQIPPGRPGNLTKEQEVKLRELWEAVMSLCGMWPGKGAAEVEKEAANERPPSPDEGGKKKRRFGSLLGRRKNNDDADASGNESASEDKYGQTKEYKQAVASQTPEEFRTTFWSFTKLDDPDALLLRFLRARKWNVHDALVMMVSTIHWRAKVMHLDEDLMKTGEGGALETAKNGSSPEKELAHDFLMQMRTGKSYLHGTDREGRPLCFVRVKLHKPGEQSEVSMDRYTVYTIETARFMLRPPVDTAVIVFDMTDFSLANMDYAPVKFMIKVFEANYPECLGHILVHKAPWLFQGIWAVIKGWLDPVVASKVHFTKNAQDLEHYIEPAHVPKGLGGGENWEYSYTEPVAGENDRMRDVAGRQAVEKERTELASQYETATIQWVKGGGNVEDVRQTRLKLAEALRENYWKLDPFIRAKSMYDRIGLIQEGGVIDMYPKESKAANVGQDDID